MGRMRKLVVVAALGMVAYAGFRWGPLVFPVVDRALGLREPAWVPAPPGSVPGTPTAEIADATLDRFERFRRGEGDGRLALSGTELSAVIRYALPGLVPSGVGDPTVSLKEGRVRVAARVALADFPSLPELERVMGLLPDTVGIVMEGVLVRLDQSFLALVIERVEASSVPIPRRMVAELLAGLGREGPPSLPADALAVPIPDGVESVFVQRDSLVLVARR